MYSHILVPTDGSPLSLKGARAAVQLAGRINAKITAVYVYPPYSAPYAGDGIFFGTKLAVEEYTATMSKLAEKALAKVAEMASDAKVPCEGEAVVNDTPWEGIIKAASKRKCDTIVMGSHGRGGISGVVLGSQTNRVLAHSKIPVLVCR